MTPTIFSGCIPALMTPCKADRSPDFDALVRKGQELIASGMSSVIYWGSMGDWPLLTYAQRMVCVQRLAEAGVPVIVGTGAVNTASAVAHAAHAQKVGAKGLMVIPRVLSRGSSLTAPRPQFKAILAAAPGAIEIGDRREAIRKGISLLHAGDTLIVAGKGHENYQILGTTKVHFDDREIVEEALKGLKA